MNQPKKSKKPPSPSAPSRSLKDCYGDVKKAYDQYSHGAFTQSEIAHVLKVSSGTGAFRSRMAAIRQFGLLDATGDKLSVSSQFLELAKNEAGTATHKKAAMACIKGCELFNTLLGEFKDKLPQRSVVAQRLETQRKFNADRAKVVAQVFEEALQWAGVLGVGNNLLPVRDDESASSVKQEQDDADVDVVDQSLPSALANMLKMELPLEDARKAVIFYPADIKVEEAKKIGNVLAAIVG